MTEQVLIQFRADKALKQEVTEIYENLGMDLPTAFRMFMVRSKMVRGLPFEATLPEMPITRTEAKKLFTNCEDRQQIFRKCRWMKSMLKFQQLERNETGRIIHSGISS